MDFWQLVDRHRANIMELAREIAGAIGEEGVKSRRHLFPELEREVERYLEAMEEVVHPALAGDALAADYVADLEREHEDIRRFMSELGTTEPKDTPMWTRRFHALVFTLDHYFNLQHNSAFRMAYSILAPRAEALRRAFGRNLIASLRSPADGRKAVVPGLTGVLAGLALGALAGVIGLALAASVWRRRQEADDLTAWDVRERSRANRAFREKHAVWLH